MTWPPLTEADIVTALAEGNITESSRLDFKAQVGDSSGARKETAKDLASFAIDGGTLLIGVREDKQARTFHPEPVDLHDVVERIEDIARNRADPPLVVRPREIPSDKEGLGYVWVDVPASPDAPHMVDSRYYGRGERTNRRLSDADVLRLHGQRRNADDQLRSALTDLQRKDPFPNARPDADAAAAPQARLGHLYLVAKPRRATPGLAESLVWDQPSDALNLVANAGSSVPEKLAGWLNLVGGISKVPRSSAISVTNLNLEAAKLVDAESYGCDVRIGTDASVGYTITGATEASADDPPTQRVLDGGILTSVWHFLGITAGVAEATGYDGTWDIGIRITNLVGARSMMADRSHGFRHDYVAFDEPQYERFSSATPLDLQTANGTVKKLTQPLLRALASWQQWQQELPELKDQN